ncbi:MAG TPA: type II toxin-antitoxin system PemK/MazF family toxin [Chthonomonadaceae bacterium]|nr:type II toxin-antitoxin system PemK/MazF family toxin [Chthonomonadaceae bacterium]
MDEEQIRQGDIFMVDWTPGRGSEQTGERTALVVQNDAFNANRRYPNTIVVTISSHGRDIPTHVQVRKTAENGLWADLSYVKAEQLMTISKDRLVRKIGSVTPEQLAAVSGAIKRVLSLV